MSKETRFYRCSICGNLTEMIEAGGGEMICCGKPMTLLEPNTKEASTEKHIPIVSKKGDILTVTVGSALHPMVEEHYIQWIYVRTENRSQRIDLNAGEKPEACFFIGNEKLLAVYEYCNLHGLWQADLSKDYEHVETVCSAEFTKSCI